jgi:hypothetical protein
MPWEMANKMIALIDALSGVVFARMFVPSQVCSWFFESLSSASSSSLMVDSVCHSKFDIGIWQSSQHFSFPKSRVTSSSSSASKSRRSWTVRRVVDILIDELISALFCGV